MMSDNIPAPKSGFMEINYVYTRKRSEFGRQCNFSDRPAEMDAEIWPDPSQALNYIKRNPCNMGIQCAPAMSGHEVNTKSVLTKSRGISHKEGGWPKRVDPDNVAQTSRYKKQLEKDEGYKAAIIKLGSVMEHCIKQNNAIDIYEEYFKEEKEMKGMDEAPTAKTTNVCRDPSEIKHTASHLSGHPGFGRELAEACTCPEYLRHPIDMCYDPYIWGIENPNKPDPEARLTAGQPGVYQGRHQKSWTPSQPQ